MDSGITLEHVVAVGGFLIALIGMGFGFWKYFEGKIERTRSDAHLAVGGIKVDLDRVREELSDHKLRVAETYVTKAGMAEQTAQILKAIDGMSGKLDHLNGRIDGLMKPAAQRTRSGG